jgi:hypothetical protein
VNGNCYQKAQSRRPLSSSSSSITSSRDGACRWTRDQIAMTGIV